MRRLCATVLIMEAIVLGLAIPVAVTISHTSPGAAGLAGGTLAGAAVLLAAVVARPRILVPTLVAGSLLQACMIAAGAVVPVMYGLGAVFAALWAVAIWLGFRYRDADGRGAADSRGAAGGGVPGRQAR